MKHIKEVIQIHFLDGTPYKIDEENIELELDTMLYDSRKEEFVLLETEKDVLEYSFVAPELYRTMTLVELIEK